MAETTKNIPIACTLNADERARRVAEWSDLRDEHLVARDDIPHGVRLRFASQPGLKDDVRALAVAEAECCAFLTLAVTGDADEVSLEITGPDDAQVVIGALAVVLDDDAAGDDESDRGLR